MSVELHLGGTQKILCLTILVYGMADTILVHGMADAILVHGTIRVAV